MTSPWWVPLADASATISCSGATHEVRWSEGSLVLPDHADLAAELALGALGASPPRCVLYRAAWRRLESDPVLVTLGRRPGESDIGIGPVPGPGGRTVFGPAPSYRDSLLLLFTLPAPLIDRAVLTACAAAAEQWDDPVFRASNGLRLGAALAARATPSLRRLGGELAGPDEAVVVHCTPSSSDERPVVMAERTEHGLEVTASIPLFWIPSVWGPGISEPDGRMVLAVRSAESPDQLDVDVAEWRPDGVDQWEAAPVPATLARRWADEPWRVS